MGNGGYDVTHYALDLGYDPDRAHLTGAARIRARATQDLSAFNFDLDGLTVQRVTVDGAPARVTHKGQELTIRPENTLDDGDVFVTTVRYAGTPKTLTDPDGSEEGWLRTADGALALGQPNGSMTWFPGNHQPADKATYDIRVTVPRGVSAVSNGELIERARHPDGGTTFGWHMPQPMASYLATVGVGKWDTQGWSTEEPGNSKDPANSREPTGADEPRDTGAPRISTDPRGAEEPEERTAADPRPGSARPGPPVLNAVDPTQASASKAVLARIGEIVTWAERRFGAYPFGSVGAIVDRPGDAGFALETQTRPAFAGAPDTRTLVHELAHQWYGDSVTPRTWRDMWLNEGFATYAEWLWEEDHGGPTAQEVSAALFAGDYGKSPGASDAMWAFPPARQPDSTHISGPPVYEGGAMVLHQVRRAMGDRRFGALLRDWAAAHRYGVATTAEFTAFAEKAAAPGQRGRLKEIWRDRLYGSSRPDGH